MKTRDKYLVEAGNKALYTKGEHVKAIMQIEKLLTVIKSAVASKEIEIGINQQVKFKERFEAAYKELAEVAKSLERGY